MENKWYNRRISYWKDVFSWVIPMWAKHITIFDANRRLHILLHVVAWYLQCCYTLFLKPLKNATNKNVTYTITDLEGNIPSRITVSNDGVVEAKETGSVRVVATADGGRQDSVQINLYSSKINSAQQINQNLTVVVGESLKITPGVDYSLFPANAIG